jgi:hypothetical protein
MRYFATLVFFSILQFFTRCDALTNSLDDEICKTMAAEGKCETQPEVTLEFCKKACSDLEKSKSYYQTFELEDDESGEYFDLTAKNWTGSTVNFSEFDGYVRKTLLPALLNEFLKDFWCWDRLTDSHTYPDCIIIMTDHLYFEHGHHLCAWRRRNIGEEH